MMLGKVRPAQLHVSKHSRLTNKDAHQDNPMTKQLKSIYKHNKGVAEVNVKSPQEVALRQHASHTVLSLIRELSQGVRGRETQNKKQTKRWRHEKNEGGKKQISCSASGRLVSAKTEEVWKNIM